MMTLIILYCAVKDIAIQNQRQFVFYQPYKNELARELRLELLQ